MSVRSSGIAGPIGIRRRMLNRRRNQRGITLIETILAMVITSTVLLPTLGFVTLTMGEQASARTLTQETSNLAATDVALIRDVSNAKAAASSTAENGTQRPLGDLKDCSGGPGAGGDVVLAMIDSQNHRVVYSLEAAGSNPQLGRSLWRRTCPNQSADTDATLGDPILLNSPDSTPTEGELLAQRVGSATSSCPRDDGTVDAQDLACRKVTLSLQSVDTSAAGAERTPVVMQATRRNTSYAAPATPPIARFTWRPTTIVDGGKVTFDASGSRDPRGGTLEYRWEFGEPLGSPSKVPASGFQDSPTTEVTLPIRTTGDDLDPMPVTLIVRQKSAPRLAGWAYANATSSVSLGGGPGVNPDNGPPAGEGPPTGVGIVVNLKKPTAKLEPVPPIEVIQNKAMTFTPTLTTYSGTTIDEATWDWGDGSPPEPACPPGGTSCTTPKSHVFTDLGLVTVQVMVRDSKGRTAQVSVAVTVIPDTIFVRTNGADGGNCGLKSAPCLTINQGISRADSTGKPKVHVAGGTYDRFSARSEIEVVGGWDNDFTTEAATTSTITGGTSGAPYGILASGVQNATVRHFTVNTPTPTSGTTQGVLIGNGAGTGSTVTMKNIKVQGGKGNQPSGVLIQNGSDVDLDAFNVTSPEAVGVGSSTYGVRVLNSTMVLKDGVIIGKPGLAGADASASRPTKTTKGCTGNTGRADGAFWGSSGNNGAPGCDATSGKGGNGGGAFGGGRGGDWGSGANAYGGGGGSYGVFGSDSGWGGGGAQGNASTPGGGGGGGVKTAAPATGAVWVGQSGAPGGNGGKGSGGGGGGGGGGNNCCAAGGGGSGGGGGAGGTRASGVGGPGGGSFGVYAYQSTVNLIGGGIIPSNGGRGGNGQPGGDGGDGGNGGGGGPNSSARGGGGGGGGRGGGGGGGAGGGAGGPSIGIYRHQSSGGQGSVSVGPQAPAPGGAGGGGGGGGGGGTRGNGADGHHGVNGSGGAGGYNGGGGQPGISATWISG